MLFAILLIYDRAVVGSKRCSDAFKIGIEEKQDISIDKVFPLTRYLYRL